jgi:hypothetical protein
LGDAGDAAARQVGRDVADVRGGVDRQIDDAHAIGPDKRHPMAAGDVGDLGLHRRCRSAPFHDTAARDDDRRDPGVGSCLRHDCGAQRVECHEGDVRPLRQRVQ